ncbi:hypothetical protein [Paracoccus mutanolyticus]|uniref:hypothetical protein n=1 Tax=Paracoccus mutanolyticus TaxID=1499308 RepID=UPI001CB926C5|nr:hypothetical protein [Paracoccus mutanolyticus]
MSSVFLVLPPNRLDAYSRGASAGLPIALLACLRAGAAYLPLDPAHPPQRIARIRTRPSRSPC